MKPEEYVGRTFIPKPETRAPSSTSLEITGLVPKPQGTLPSGFQHPLFNAILRVGAAQTPQPVMIEKVKLDAQWELYRGN